MNDEVENMIENPKEISTKQHRLNPENSLASSPEPAGKSSKSKVI